ncbi:hypothetical protein COV87_00535 [Candidatus Roizmanbacteria bacterium CG11_big_fil_rev_8_21_14_0_20_37_16]|uniref:Uncharacterized protein n=1 Tax=Candidatus Roizmanbacteria bacterium CG11_big_fil_rev_8_21_14_0_20_37_16 TaxID=1974857 RepID=A0A2H0KN26_9BACT|nr:MAG: hypothetical protein COV87_00535 [Candidatus Roizmanbacteria bacterium CG11_big_fil_rev_8_21_14_0_20_37_16]
MSETTVGSEGIVTGLVVGQDNSLFDEGDVVTAINGENNRNLTFVWDRPAGNHERLVIGTITRRFGLIQRSSVGAGAVVDLVKSANVPVANRQQIVQARATH